MSGSAFFVAGLAPYVDAASGEAAVDDIYYFSSDDSGTFEIYSSSPSGDAVLLTNDPATDSWRPRLSPNRQTVLFYRTPAGVLDSDLTQASLWMMTAGGGDAVEVLPPGSYGWRAQGHAEWSPLGNELVMIGERSEGRRIWITSADGRDVRLLADDPADDADPSWSPDGKRVLYTACVEAPCPDAEREVFVVLATGGDRIQITSDDLADGQPSFSPDGSQIVMRTQIEVVDDEGQGGVWDLRVVPTNRTRPPLRIVNDTSNSASPVWRDNATLLFHHRETAGDDWGLFAVTLTGGDLTPLRDTAANEMFPAP